MEKKAAIKFDDETDLFADKQIKVMFLHIYVLNSHTIRTVLKCKAINEHTKIDPQFMA